MTKSPDLFTLCDVCAGEGVSKDSELNYSPNGRAVCIVCQGDKYLPMGLNKAQVDAALRKAGEYDQLAATSNLPYIIGNKYTKAMVDLLRSWMESFHMSEHWNADRTLELYNATDKALKDYDDERVRRLLTKRDGN